MFNGTGFGIPCSASHIESDSSWVDTTITDEMTVDVDGRLLDYNKQQ
jgi:hypothetical protein